MIISVEVEHTGNGLDNLDKNKRQATRDGLEKASMFFESEIVKKLDSGTITPPLAPATIARKKSSKPLIDTSQLYDQVTSVVESDTEAKAGVVGPRAGIAAIHEFGSPKNGIPERSFIRSTYNAKRKHIKEKFIEGFMTALRQ